MFLVCPSNHTRYVDFWSGPCNGPFVVRDLACYSDFSMGLSMDGINFCVFLVARKASMSIRRNHDMCQCLLHKVAVVPSISCYRSLIHAWCFSRQIFKLWLALLATLRLIMVSHKSTDSSWRIFDYSSLEKCLYLSSFPSTVSMSAVLSRRRTKEYLLHSRLHSPQHLTFRACLGHRP